MTNFEYLKNLDIEKCADFISSYIKDENYCELCINKQDKCITCIEDWLKKEHKNEMPDLKNGMFIMVDTGLCIRGYKRLGVVINNNTYGKIIVYKDGTWETLNDIRDFIIKVYSDNVNCFNGCLDTTEVWSKE